MQVGDNAEQTTEPELPEGVALRTIALTKRFDLPRLWRPGAADDADDDEDGEVDDDDRPDETAARPGLALDAVDLALARGSMVGLVGPEAAGKTTLVKLVAGTLRPTSGRIVVRGGRVAPPPEPVAKLLEPAHTPARNLGLVAAMLGVSQARAVDSAPEVFAAAGLSGVESRPLQSLPPDTASALAMAAFLHLDVSVFLLDPAPKIRSPEIRERLFGLLRKRLGDGACALVTARVEVRLPEGCHNVLELDDGRARQFRPVELVRKNAPAPPPPPTKFLGHSDVVALGDISVSTDPSGGGTSIRIPVEVLDPAAKLTFGVMLAHDGRALAKYTKPYERDGAGPLRVTVHVPGQRHLAGKHQVHFSVIVARGDERQVVVAQPIKAALRRGLHAPDAEAAWSVEAM